MPKRTSDHRIWFGSGVAILGGDRPLLTSMATLEPTQRMGGAQRVAMAPGTAPQEMATPLAEQIPQPVRANRPAAEHGVASLAACEQAAKMQAMQANPEPILTTSSRRRATWEWIALASVLVLGAWMRFADLAGRSLWMDELSTWHVSRMELEPSLRWGPELTKPPAYQFALRLISDAAKPTEQVLRLPAAVCGVAAIAAFCWLGRRLGGWACGLALAILVAANPLQIQWAREARPYSMLTLGTVISFVLWFRLVREPSRRALAAYVLVTAITFHAHYLTALIVLAQLLWWVAGLAGGHRGRSARFASIGLVLVGALCTPMALHYLRYRSSVFQGLDWIPPADWMSAMAVLGEVTFGRAWAWCVLPAGLLVVLTRWRAPKSESSVESDAESSAIRLLITWLFCAWLGLLVVSWIAHPVMVARYALPAAAPALLIPLMAARRIHKLAPLGVALALGLIGLADALTRHDATLGGYRELTAYLNEHVDRRSEAVVLCMEEAVDPEWATMKRLGFAYYPLDGSIELHELLLDPEFADLDQPILRDPRGLYVLAFRADPLPLLQAAGRHGAPIEYDGALHPTLAFGLYRVLKVAPIE